MTAEECQRKASGHAQAEGQHLKPQWHTWPNGYTKAFRVGCSRQPAPRLPWTKLLAAHFPWLTDWLICQICQHLSAVGKELKKIGNMGCPQGLVAAKKRTFPDNSPDVKHKVSSAPHPTAQEIPTSGSSAGSGRMVESESNKGAYFWSLLGSLLIREDTPYTIPVDRERTDGCPQRWATCSERT